MKFFGRGFVGRTLLLAYVLVSVAGLAHLINDWFMDSRTGYSVVNGLQWSALYGSGLVIIAGMAFAIIILLMEALNWALNGRKERPGPSARVKGESRRSSVGVMRLFGQIPLATWEWHKKEDG